MKTALIALGWGAVIALVIFVLSSSGGGSSSDSYERYSDPDYDSYISETEDMYDMAYDNWDIVREYIDGTETIEACSDSGCYSLDADISYGYISTVYFPNGGYISPDAEIDSDGHASGYDSDGNDWSFEVDERILEDAIENWYEDYQDSRDSYYERDYDYYR